MEGKSGLGKLVSMSSVSNSNVQLHKDSRDVDLHCCICQYLDMLICSLCTQYGVVHMVGGHWIHLDHLHYSLFSQMLIRYLCILNICHMQSGSDCTFFFLKHAGCAGLFSKTFSKQNISDVCVRLPLMLPQHIQNQKKLNRPSSGNENESCGSRVKSYERIKKQSG